MNKSFILYIEDEEDYQMLVRRILEPAAFDVGIVGTGEAGRDAARRRRPDLLILDINLPDTDGYSLCRLLRQDPAWKNLPILMLTVRRRPEEWLRGFSAGASDYLCKPLNPPELIERVREGLNGRSLALQRRGAPEYLLIQAAAAGNRAAFEVLIEKYRSRLVESMRVVARNASEVEDIVSKAFLYAYENLREFRGEASFYTWLYRIAANESMYVTERARTVSFEQVTQDGEYAPLKSCAAPEPAVHDGPDPDPNPSPRVKKSLNRLPAPYGQMMKMYFLHEMSYQEIADRMRIPLGTVMSRLFRARQLLREKWTMHN